jgi:hypothetical protein
MGVTSQVTDCDRFVRETGKGVALVGNVQDIDREPVEPFFKHLLYHRVLWAISLVPSGVNLYPSAEFTFESNKF